MINQFKNIGEAILTRDGYYKSDNILEKREIFLFHQSIVPNIRKDNNGNPILEGRAICLNFDLENVQIEFRQSDFELIDEYRREIMAFKIASIRKSYF